jgi:hypothetical protein
LTANDEIEDREEEFITKNSKRQKAQSEVEETHFVSFVFLSFL